MIVVTRESELGQVLFRCRYLTLLAALRAGGEVEDRMWTRAALLPPGYAVEVALRAAERRDRVAPRGS